MNDLTSDDMVVVPLRTWTDDDMCEFCEWCGKQNLRYNHPSNQWMDGNFGFNTTQTLLQLFLQHKENK